METIRKPIRLFGGVLFFAAVFFLPLESERFMTALDAALDLIRWYAREHVVLCLLPAFFIAGLIAVFVSQGAVLKYLGTGARRWLSYSVAALSGGILAVCSCTVLPLFSSIYRRGAGLGPAVAFLYSGPAISLLSVILTIRVLGVEMGVARLACAVIFSVVIGIGMSYLFRGEERERQAEKMHVVPPSGEYSARQIFLLLLVSVSILVFANWGAPARNDTGWWWSLYAGRWQVVGLLSLVFCGALVRILKLKASWVLLGAVCTTIAALLSLRFVPDGRFAPLIPMAVAITALSLILLSDRGDGANRDWLFASWGFAGQIMPLLAVGVLAAGFLLGSTHDGVSVAGVVPDGWISWAVGGNSLRSCFLSALVGAFMYFATLTEVPIVQGLLVSGMGEGPALALLLAGPSLSLPAMLVIGRELGAKKTAVYVALVVALATFAGWIFGRFY